MVGAMKHKWIPAALLAVAALIAGCDKNTPVEVPGTPEGEKPSGTAVTLTVSAVAKGNDSATKIAYGATDATWEDGDKIFLVKSDGTTIILTLSAGAGEVTGTFTSTDPVVAGTYIPYAVSGASLSKGYVLLSSGSIILNLSKPGGATLADALEHDVLKGDALTLADNQTSASITGLNTHILSYFRFRFASSSRAVTSIGMDSAGGLCKSVTIAADGTISGTDSSTEVFRTTASDDGAGVYAGYFAIYESTTTNLMAHAEIAGGKKLTRLVTNKDVNYTPGLVYGKTFQLSEDMATSGAAGTYGGQRWKDLGLSVRWAEFNVGSSSEYSYDRNIGNEESESVVPAGWNGWRHPTRAEACELFFASERQWVTAATNGVRFNCNGNYLPMGAGGYYRWRDDGNDWEYSIGSTAYFYINETTSGGVNGTVRIWATVSNEGQSLGFGASNLGSNLFYFGNTAAMRLVCDYVVQESEAETEEFTVGGSFDINDFETE